MLYVVRTLLQREIVCRECIPCNYCAWNKGQFEGKSCHCGGGWMHFCKSEILLCTVDWESKSCFTRPCTTLYIMQSLALSLRLAWYSQLGSFSIADALLVLCQRLYTHTVADQFLIYRHVVRIDHKLHTLTKKYFFLTTMINREFFLLFY